MHDVFPPAAMLAPPVVRVGVGDVHEAVRRLDDRRIAVLRPVSLRGQAGGAAWILALGRKDHGHVRVFQKDLWLELSCAVVSHRDRQPEPPLLQRVIGKEDAAIMERDGVHAAVWVWDGHEACLAPFLPHLVCRRLDQEPVPGASDHPQTAACLEQSGLDNAGPLILDRLETLPSYPAILAVLDVHRPALALDAGPNNDGTIVEDEGLFFAGPIIDCGSPSGRVHVKPLSWTASAAGSMSLSCSQPCRRAAFHLGPVGGLAQGSSTAPRTAATRPALAPPTAVLVPGHPYPRVWVLFPQAPKPGGKQVPVADLCDCRGVLRSGRTSGLIEDKAPAHDGLRACPAVVRLCCFGDHLRSISMHPEPPLKLL
eukprot:CAMPEP_0177588362 /NCGR_PEP_ID=MMETSP0419_2-20121207/6184_1 /TAXON_ID=582737 /ORGANISM="Tetraselmis sp., Strain GSL018" /LENGTH=368 /DNA_ID=CAMNT_0019078553 /DNA_START=247 /DNA_END=1356 /DNA_ORIENTATION=-